MKKVLILSGSPRKDGNSDLLCSEFMRGAQESGNEVQKIFVRSKKIVPCNACYYCRDHGGKCALNDDMSEILDAMQAADVIVMASPVYFYSIDAQMKIIIDRSLARWTNIKDIRQYIELSMQGDDTIDTRLEMFRHQREVLTQQIQQLQHTLETVEYKCWFYEAAKAAGTVDVPGAMTDADVPEQFRAIRQELRGQKMPNIER